MQNKDRHRQRGMGVAIVMCWRARADTQQTAAGRDVTFWGAAERVQTAKVRRRRPIMGVWAAVALSRRGRTGRANG